MPQELPNLAGVATKDLVEKIGTGKYSAEYINWSRTLELLRRHAPGWCVETVATEDGGLVHKAPGNGGYLLIRFCHLDGTTTPAVPQAVMDNRNAAIPFDKISSRDVTDTHRRGACLAAAMTFGLAYELWAKIPVESGYADSDSDVQSTSSGTTAQRPVSSPSANTATREQFLESAIQKGLTTYAAEKLASQLNGNYDGGIKRLSEKDDAWVKEYNESCAPKDNAEQW